MSRSILRVCIFSILILPLMTEADAFDSTTAPKISVTGSPWGKIRVDISNGGVEEYTNITWSVCIRSVIPSQWYWEGRIPSISPGHSVKISNEGLVFGLTRTNVDVTVWPEGYPAFQYTTQLIIFFSIILIRH